MSANLRESKALWTQRRIESGATLIGVFWLLLVMACSTISKPGVSTPPVLHPINPHTVVHLYLQEFDQVREKYYWVPISPDQKWEVYIERENMESLPAGFYSLRLRKKDSGDSRVLFTLWDADVGSGVRANARWSKDGKALQLSGDTRGFSYEPLPEAMKYESFNFIYLVEEDKIYSVPNSRASAVRVWHDLPDIRLYSIQ